MSTSLFLWLTGKSIAQLGLATFSAWSLSDFGLNSVSYQDPCLLHYFYGSLENQLHNWDLLLFWCCKDRIVFPNSEG
jgi:hypothetical protein